MPVVDTAETLRLPGQGGGDPRDLRIRSLLRRLGDRDRELAVEVGALLAGSLAQPIGVEVAPADQVGEQLAAHPLSASASMRPKSRTSAVTRAPRSSVRRSGRSSGSVERSTSVPRCSSPAAATATQTVPGLHAAARGLGLVDGVLDVGEVAGLLTGEQATLVVVHRQAAAEHLRQHVGDLDHAACRGAARR